MGILEAMQAQHTSSCCAPAAAACLTLLRGFSASPAAAHAAAAAAAQPIESDPEDDDDDSGDEIELLELPPPIPLERHVVQGQYRDVVVPLYDLSRREVGTVTLGGDVFDVPIRRDILHRVVRWQLAKQQQGTHKALTRSEVRGGGRKPRPQKGSGQSRQGTIRAPQW